MGAREHYLAARALHRNDKLSTLHTDFWASGFLRPFLNLSNSNSLQALASKYHWELESANVSKNNLDGLRWIVEQRHANRQGNLSKYRSYMKIGERFTQKAETKLIEMQKSDEFNVVFGFNTCSLEVMRRFEAADIKTILSQIDPCQTEIRMVKEEQQVWKGWEEFSLDVPEEFIERIRAEWEVADCIIVNSHFSKTALVEQGVNSSKISVLPLAYENEPDYGTAAEHVNSEKNFSELSPMIVLFLGQVILRKGVQYLIEAAKTLINEPIRFEIIGPLGLSRDVLAKMPENVIIRGPIPRAQTKLVYQAADLFILPTLSDGFAITQIEAMSYGLPVIATSNCGNVVTDALDGRIIPTRNSQAIKDAILEYLHNPKMREKHRKNALLKSKSFTVDRYYNGLNSIVNGIDEVFL